MKKIVIGGVLILVALAVFFLARTYYKSAPLISSPDYKNISYKIDNRDITLKDGISELDIVPGSASKLITTYFGNEAHSDLNSDGTEDVAFILTQSGGGSGTFYYVVAALKINDVYRGTNAILLGDRIAPQNIEIKNGQIIANYADRKPGEPMTTPPSVGRSKYITLSGTILVEAPRGAAFAMPITLHINENVLFPDGLLLSLKEINDSRCKTGVVCVWQGELAAVLIASKGGFASSEEIRLGTVTKKSTSLKGYTFSLKNATEESITLIVSL